MACSPPARAPPWWLPSSVLTGPWTCWGKAAKEMSVLLLSSGKMDLGSLGKKGGAWDGRKRSRACPRAAGGNRGAAASQTLSRARKTDRLHPEVKAGACPSLQSRNRNSMPKSKGKNSTLLAKKKIPLIPVPLSPVGAVCLGSFHVSPLRFTPPLPCCFFVLALPSFPSAPRTAKPLSWAARLPHSALYRQCHVSSQTADLSVSTNFLRHNRTSLPSPAVTLSSPAAPRDQKEVT